MASNEENKDEEGEEEEEESGEEEEEEDEEEEESGEEEEEGEINISKLCISFVAIVFIGLHDFFLERSYESCLHRHISHLGFCDDFQLICCS